MGNLPDYDGKEGKTPPGGYTHFDKRGRLWYCQYGQNEWGWWPTNLLIYERLTFGQSEVPFKEVPYGELRDN